MNEIKIENLSFSYISSDPILTDINLTIDHRTTAIIGQNGAGKTTFVKLLKGLLKPSAGNILLNNENINSKSVATLSKYIGLVFQNPDDQIFKHTVLEEVMFGPLNIGMSQIDATNAANEALNLVGLSNLRDENPYDLGLSERKLIAIASILSMDTPVVILDEPTIAQDYKSKEKIKHIINHLKEQGKIVITIIHDMDFVADCFDRTIVFAKGRVLVDDVTENVFQDEILLKNAYLELPHIASLCKQLSLNSVLTVEQFIDIWKCK